MNISSSGRQVFLFLYITTIVSLILVLVFVIAQAYIRWTLNQNFTFLGGGELEVLTFCSFALVLGITRMVHRNPDNS